MWFHELMQYWERFAYYPTLKPEDPGNAHNALADAEWGLTFLSRLKNWEDGARK
jgi:hypothetical protein